MAISPSCILIESERLCTADASEATLRTSIGRGYYALFHAALKYADSISQIPIGDMHGGTHEKLSSFFTARYDADKDYQLKLRKIGYNLKRLHGIRVKADYYLDKDITLAEAESILISCKDHIGVLAQLSESIAA